MSAPRPDSTPFCRNCESYCEPDETECCDKQLNGWTWGDEAEARASEVDSEIAEFIRAKERAGITAWLRLQASGLTGTGRQAEINTLNLCADAIDSRGAP